MFHLIPCFCACFRSIPTSNGVLKKHVFPIIIKWLYTVDCWGSLLNQKLKQKKKQSWWEPSRFVVLLLWPIHAGNYACVINVDNHTLQIHAPFKLFLARTLENWCVLANFVVNYTWMSCLVPIEVETPPHTDNMQLVGFCCKSLVLNQRLVHLEIMRTCFFSLPFSLHSLPIFFSLSPIFSCSLCFSLQEGMGAPVLTDDVSLQVFMEHLKKLAVSSSMWTLLLFAVNYHNCFKCFYNYSICNRH